MLLPHYDPAQHLPPPPPLPTLTVTPAGTLYLHASLRYALGLYPGQPIDLVAPTWKSVFWHLDLRPSARCRVHWHGEHSLRARGVQLPPGFITTPRTLYLLPGPPPLAHCYPLLLAAVPAAPQPVDARPLRRWMPGTIPPDITTQTALPANQAASCPKKAISSQ